MTLRTQLEELAGKAKRLGCRDPQWIHSVVDFKALCWRNRETILSALEAVEWQPIETLTKADGVVIGLRDPSHTGRQPAFIGELYDVKSDALIDCWSGRWAVCTHWRPLGPVPENEHGR